MSVESPWLLRLSAPGGSNLVSVTVFEIFRVKILTVHLLTLVGLTTEPKVTKMRDELPSTQIYHPIKFQPDCANGLRDMHYQFFSVLGPKFTKCGDDMVDSDVYHPAKFHRPKSTHARDIRYQNPADKKTKTNKQTVNDISTTCLSACVDNKYKSVRV